MGTYDYKPNGNPTDIGLLNLLHDHYPINTLMNRKYSCIRGTIPFQSEYKLQATALENPERKKMISIFVKGAPE